MIAVARSIRTQFVNLRPTRWFVYIFVRVVLGIVCRVDSRELSKVPPRGPLITISNHTGSLEVPIIGTWLYPRPVTAWAKIETWDNRLMGWLFDVWGAIPLRRGEADMFALRTALQKLQEGYILGVAPEGTRSRTGKLLRGHPGAVTLALRSNAPFLPIVHWGGEKLMSNLKRFRRTSFSMRVGKPFRLNINGERLTREQRQQVVDEMMYQVAALLPEEYRGEYSDMSKATAHYLKFDIPTDERP